MLLEDLTQPGKALHQNRISPEGMCGGKVGGKDREVQIQQNQGPRQDTYNRAGERLSYTRHTL